MFDLLLALRCLGGGPLALGHLELADFLMLGLPDVINTAAALTGTYFTASNYVIDSVGADGTAVITVTGSQSNAPSGSKTLTAAGTFE